MQVRCRTAGAVKQGAFVQGLTSASKLAVVCLPAGVTPVGIPVWKPPMVALHSLDGRDTQEAFGSPLWGFARDRWVSESC